MNLKAMVVSSSSVKVSWERPDTARISGYRVMGYAVVYSLIGGSASEEETIMNVQGMIDVNSLKIKHLISGMEYQFQVTVLAEVDGLVIKGGRSQSTRIVVLIPVNLLQGELKCSGTSQIIRAL